MKTKIKQREKTRIFTHFPMWAGVFVFVFALRGEIVSAATCGGATSCACGDNVISDYTLTQDLDCRISGSNGLIIGDGSPDTGTITLDCNGFNIYGSLTDSSYSGIINFRAAGNNRGNFVIKNCNIHGFKNGIYIGGNGSYSLNNITIKNNNFYLSYDKSIWAILAVAGSYGTNIIITENDILDTGADSTSGMIFSNIGEGSEISFNRILKYRGFDVPDIGGEALYVGAANNIKIFGNYIDCSRMSKAVITASAPTHKYDRCTADLRLVQANNVKIYDNIFAGSGVVFESGSGNEWCPSVSGYRGNAGAKVYRNIFANRGYFEGSANPIVKIPNECNNDPECGGTCAKTCLTSGGINGNQVKIDGTDGNVCFQGGDTILHPDTLSVPAVEFPENKNNLGLLCNQNPDTFENTGRLKRQGNPGGTGIKMSGTKRSTIIGCVVEIYSTGIEANNSQDALLRENWVQAIDSSVDPEAKQAAEEAMRYYYRIFAVPDTDIADYNHKIYNPYLYYLTHIGSSEGNDLEGIYVSNKKNYIVGYGGSPKKDVLYYYNWKVGYDSGNIYDITEIDSEHPVFGAEFQNVGHLTVASSTAKIKVKNITITRGDPITVAGVKVSSAESGEILANTVSANGGEGIYVVGSSNISVENNTLRGNFYGLKAGFSDALKIYSNTIDRIKTISPEVKYPRKPGSFGGFFLKLTNSEIGKSGGGNTFKDYGGGLSTDGGGGVYFEGSYDGTAQSVREQNVFQYNNVQDNFYFGLVVFNAYTNKFLNNNITNNGRGDDSTAECNDSADNDNDTKTDATEDGFNDTGCVDDTSPYELGQRQKDISELSIDNRYAECSDGVDNDKDGKIDFGAFNDPDCITVYDISESYSPGFYINNSKTNVIKDNTISDNSGDNLYIDSSANLQLKTDGSGDFECTGKPLDANFNIFLGNKMNQSLHGSGVVLDADSCFQYSGTYPSEWGNVFFNSFGHYYLPVGARGDVYYDSPDAIGDNDGGAPFGYRPSDYGTLPLPGGNEMNGNFLDGITIQWHLPPGGDDSKVRANDFFKNTINNNLGYGINLNGQDKPLVLYGNDIIGNTLNNNALGGIYLNNATFSRVFGNTITVGSATPNNTIFGIRVEKTKDSSNYNEIGYTLGFDPDNPAGGCPVGLGQCYKNTIDLVAGSYETGIYLLDDAYSILLDNEIKNYGKFGIRGFSSERATLEGNKVSGGKAGSVGIYLSSVKNNLTTNWILQKNEIFDIDPTARYLYIGPENKFSKANGNNFYPYPDTSVLSFYSHTLPDSGGLENKAGPTGDLKTIYYYYNQDGPKNFDQTNLDTYHFQVVNSKNFTVGGATSTELVFNNADPVEIIFYPKDQSDPDGRDFNFIKFQNCPGECLLLYNINNSIRFNRITVDSSRLSGIKGFYVENARFTNNTITNGVNSSDTNENGGFYLYNSRDNDILDNTFKYKNSDAGVDVAKRKWDVFLSGYSTGNTFLRNTFGDGTDPSASGAYELRAELVDRDYKSADADQLRGDYMCNADSTVCDPNCTELDQQCKELAPSGCGSGNNCCALFNEISWGFDEECGPANTANNSQVALAPCHSGDDGCCLPAEDSNRDPNCANTGDPDSGIFDPLEDINCSPSGIDCCIPFKDNSCDYDCPYGFDPDCVATGNYWCDGTTANNNDFANIKTKKPNYYDATLSPPDGGGGQPNGSYFCYYPRAKFSTTGSITQRAKYRELGLTDRDKNIFRFNVNDAWFADLRGQDLIGRIQVSADGGVWQNSISNFVSGSLKLTYVPFSPYPYNPTIALSGNYRLGDLAKAPVRTPDITGLDSYPGSLWTSVYKTGYSFIWDAYNMKNSSIGFYYEYSGVRYARLQVQNRQGKAGSAGNDIEEGETTFSYDFKRPQISTWNLSVSGTSTASYPKTYRLEWTPVALADELNWTAAGGHYEVWFGDDVTEVKNRANSSTSIAGPFVWDDLSPGSATVATKRGVLPYQKCGASDPTKDTLCYESKLNKIDCIPSAVSGKCVTYVKIQDPSTALATYTIQGEYSTSDATIEECQDDDNSNGRQDKDDNFGDAVTLKSDKVEGSCGGGTVNDREQRILVRWDTSGIPAASCPTVSNAEIHMQISNGTATSDDYNVFEMLKSWGEDSVTWSKRDATNNWTTAGADASNDDRGTTDLVNTFPTGTGYKTASFNATGLTLIQDWISKTRANNGLIIVYKVQDDGVEMNSSEGTEPPKLVIQCAAQGTAIDNPQFNVCAVDDYGNEQCSSAPDIKPWVETRYGNIYSGGNVGENTAAENDLPQGQCSATFLILAKGTIDKWKADGCAPTVEELTIPDGTKERESYTAIQDLTRFPNKGNNFVFDLGSLDYLDKPSASYVADVIKDLESRYGKYRVQQINNISEVSNTLGGKIYVSTASLDISDAAKVFNNGAGETPGSGLIIVNGNLTIGQNITYGAGSPAKLKNLASVVWIVLGSININPSVTEISGAYIALGTPTDPCVVNCGVIDTGNNSSASLTVNGMLMARSFIFARTYASASQGSEIIIYDGRILANPPPGIEDFAKNFPVWKK